MAPNVTNPLILGITQWVKDPGLRELWCRLAAAAPVRPQPGNFRMPQVWPLKKKKKKLCTIIWESFMFFGSIGIYFINHLGIIKEYYIISSYTCFLLLMSPRHFILNFLTHPGSWCVLAPSTCGAGTLPWSSVSGLSWAIVFMQSVVSRTSLRGM